MEKLVKRSLSIKFISSRWSRLIPQKWQNTINQRRITKKKGFNKIGFKKPITSLQTKNNNFEVYSLPNPNKKKSFQKYYKYDILSYKSINFKRKTDSYIIYGQINNNQIFFYNFLYIYIY